MIERPLVGVSVIVKQAKAVLIGKRRNAHGDGCWGFPGGHLEFNEEIETCARREVLEETGIEITNLAHGPFTNDMFTAEGKHYVTIYMTADYHTGDVSVMEPEKCERWIWRPWDQLPQPLFLPIRNLLQLGYNPFEFWSSPPTNKDEG